MIAVMAYEKITNAIITAYIETMKQMIARMMVIIVFSSAKVKLNHVA